MDDSELASVCKEDFLANFKVVSQHLYDVTEQTAEGLFEDNLCSIRETSRSPVC